MSALLTTAKSYYIEEFNPQNYQYSTAIKLNIENEII